MRNLSVIGRVFYGLFMIEAGLQTMYCRDFPYMLAPPNHLLIPGFTVLAVIFGGLCAVAGVCIVSGKMARPVSLWLGALLLLNFCFYFIPYEFFETQGYMHLAEWENAEKELAVAGGAFVIAGCFPAGNEGLPNRFLAKLVPIGAIMFAVPVISFGILHFQHAAEASTLVPAWIPNHLFWTYLAGVGLLGSGIAIILKIKVHIIAALLGGIIFIWFVSLHIPRVVVAAPADRADEITSALLALAYSGIAFVISGSEKKALRNP